MHPLVQTGFPLVSKSHRRHNIGLGIVCIVECVREGLLVHRRGIGMRLG